jgi:hypothetical protein
MLLVALCGCVFPVKVGLRLLLVFLVHNLKSFTVPHKKHAFSVFLLNLGDVAPKVKNRFCIM